MTLPSLEEQQCNSLSLSSPFLQTIKCCLVSSRFINHSCDPNCEVNKKRADSCPLGYPVVSTIRVIAPGEEVLSKIVLATITQYSTFTLLSFSQRPRLHSTMVSAHTEIQPLSALVLIVGIQDHSLKL